MASASCRIPSEGSNIVAGSQPKDNSAVKPRFPKRNFTCWNEEKLVWEWQMICMETVVGVLI